MWMFFSAFKSGYEIYQPLQFYPTSFGMESFSVLLSGQLIDGPKLPFSFGGVFIHSTLAAGGQALLATSVTAMAGYAFAKLKFPGKGVLFLLVIFIILVPRQALAIPVLKWIALLGLRGNLWSIILLGAVSGIGVIFFTQMFRRIPDSLVDLARVEGSSEFRTFITLLPLLAPALVTYGLIHFILAWQEHLLPLLLLSDDYQTLPLALTKLRDSSYRIPASISMAAATFVLLPVLLLFSIFHRQMRTALRDFTAH